jgi:hypothetical protein
LGGDVFVGALEFHGFLSLKGEVSKTGSLLVRWVKLQLYSYKHYKCTNFYAEDPGVASVTFRRHVK